jgi:hypothetical protein
MGMPAISACEVNRSGILEIPHRVLRKLGVKYQLAYGQLMSFVFGAPRFSKHIRS